MNKLILVISFCAFSLGAFAQKNVKLKINHKLGDATFAYNQESTNDISSKFNISRLEYYISQISITHDGGNVTDAKDVYLLVNGNSTMFELGSYDVTSIEAITFYIGVESPANNADPSKWPAGHALAPKSPSMHWGWASGYRFVAYEGYAGSSLSTNYQIHALGNQNYFKQKIATSATDDGGDLLISLNADYSQAISSVPVETGVVTHGDYDEAATLLRNFQNKVFTNASGEGNVLAVKTIEVANALTIYPNPSEGKVWLTASDARFVNSEVKISNLLGSEVLKTTLNGGTATLNLDTKGMYIAELTNTDGFTSTKKFIVQ